MPLSRRSFLVFLAAPLATGLPAAPLHAQVALDPELERWRRGLENDSREVYRRRHEIVAAMALRPGMRVADIGAGSGLFSRLMARAVQPGGVVYAVDISERTVERLLRIAKAEGVTNIVGVVGTATSTRLAPASIDLAYLCDSYHHFSHPEETLASIRTALKPGGRVVLVDFERIPGVSPAWILEHVKHPKEEVVKQFVAAGFEYVGEQDFLAQNYFVVFRRP